MNVVGRCVGSHACLRHYNRRPGLSRAALYQLPQLTAVNHDAAQCVRSWSFAFVLQFLVGGVNFSQSGFKHAWNPTPRPPALALDPEQFIHIRQ